MTEGGGRRLALATPHSAATDAGAAAFKAGGNAVDAALTACSVLAVVYPHMCSIGGDLFALLHRPGGEVVAINGSGAAPVELSPEDVGLAMPVTGPHTITVPGVLAGWETLRADAASFGLDAILEPAIGYANDGCAVAPSLARAFASQRAALSQDPGMAATFLSGGAPRNGAVIRQRALAETLRTIACDGVSAFYRGEVGRAFVDGVRALGSRLSASDLAAHDTEITEPLAAPFGSRQVVTAPPNSQGFVLLEILLLLERLGLAPDALGEPAAALARAFELASRDRDLYLADPRFSRVPVDELLTSDHIDRLGRRVQRVAASGDTVAVVAADDEGWAVSVIQSVFSSFGSGLLEPSTGIVCHNRGASFSLDDSSSNVLRGGKRPAHTLMPVLVLNDAGLEIVAGTMGGFAQPQIHAQILGRLLSGMDVSAAVSAPRWVTGGVDAGDRRDVVWIERSAFERCGRALESTGRHLIVLEDGDEEVGHAQYIVARDGAWSAASDARADGSAVVL